MTHEALSALLYQNNPSADPTQVAVKKVYFPCQHPSCNIQSSFAFPGEKPRLCATHRLPDMVNTKTKRCEDPSCFKSPLFAIEGTKRPRFCATHKAEGMINVQSVRCCHPEGCPKNATFAHWDESRPRFCAEHKERSMVDVRSRRCEQDGCGLRPSFAATGDRIARFCGKHKTAAMVDVRHRTCCEPGCSLRSTFAMQGAKTDMQVCLTHRQDGMTRMGRLLPAKNAGFGNSSTGQAIDGESSKEGVWERGEWSGKQVL